MGDQKIYVTFSDDHELRRGVSVVTGFGGVTFLGVASLSGKTFAVFTSENDASKLMADVMKAGVGVLSVVVKGVTEHGPFVRGLAPVVIQCDHCGESMLYEFSKAGMQLCDVCLAKVIETPTEREG